MLLHQAGIVWQVDLDGIPHHALHSQGFVRKASHLAFFAFERFVSFVIVCCVLVLVNFGQPTPESSFIRFCTLRRRHVHQTALNPRARPRHESIDVRLYTEKKKSDYLDFYNDPCLDVLVWTFQTFYINETGRD